MDQPSCQAILFDVQSKLIWDADGGDMANDQARKWFALALAVGIFVSGCTSPEIPTVTPAPTPALTATAVSTVTVLPTPAPTATATAPPMPTTMPPPSATSSATPIPVVGKSIHGGAQGNTWHLREVRILSAAGRSRIIFELAEPYPATPAFTVTELSNVQVIAPRTAGTPAQGEPAFPAGIWGAARLEVTLEQVYLERSVAEMGLDRPVTNDPFVTRIGTVATNISGTLGIVIGLQVPANFEVTALRQPNQLVIDIQ
ncbi:MAG: hypothetical protein EXR62_15230 [Chloroflexi bacterium]|nr:hypothetical protein [Chloroflexota bacterium]